MSGPLPERCRTALRYYVGEAAARPELPRDKKAYNTLNVLFFDGLSAERARAAEGRQLNGDFLSVPGPLLQMCRDLLEALDAGRSLPAQGPLYRVEREADAEVMEALARTVSFTSTSRAGFLPAYTDKRGLVLMEFRLLPGTPRGDMAALLSRYIKPEEAEVLLPPGLSLRFAERALTPAEAAIRDRDGAPPRRALTVTAGPGAAERDFPAGGAAAGMRVYAALERGAEPEPEDADMYLCWKGAFRCRLAGLRSG